MKWKWFGWFGLLCLCGFWISVTFPNVTVPNEIHPVYYKLISVIFLFAMVSSIVCPVIACIRSSKWWLIVSAAGLAAAVKFFTTIAA